MTCTSSSKRPGTSPAETALPRRLRFGPKGKLSSKPDRTCLEVRKDSNPRSEAAAGRCSGAQALAEIARGASARSHGSGGRPSPRRGADSSSILLSSGARQGTERDELAVDAVKLARQRRIDLPTALPDACQLDRRLDPDRQRRQALQVQCLRLVRARQPQQRPDHRLPTTESNLLAPRSALTTAAVRLAQHAPAVATARDSHDERELPGRSHEFLHLRRPGRGDVPDLPRTFVAPPGRRTTLCRADLWSPSP